MNKEKLHFQCIEFSSSSDEELSYVELSELQVAETKVICKPRSECSEKVSGARPILLEQIETSLGEIFLQKQQFNLKVMTEKDWIDYFKHSSEVTILMHCNAVYSVIKGLNSRIKPIYWSRFCEGEEVSQKINRHPNSDPNKYKEAIQTSLLKLSSKYQNIGYNTKELQKLTQYAHILLSDYATNDPEVGFERGMEYLAFAIVDSITTNTKITEETSARLLQCMQYIMRKLQFRGLFLPSKPSIFSKIKNLQQKIKAHLPKLYNYLSELDIQFSKLFFKYYISLFLYNVHQRVLVSKLIQLLLLEGEDFVSYIILRILSQTQNQILKIPKHKLEQHVLNNLFKNYFDNLSQDSALTRLEGLLIKRTNLQE